METERELLYMHFAKLALAAMNLRRVRVFGRRREGGGGVREREREALWQQLINNSEAFSRKKGLYGFMCKAVS
jgi:hypothetical protein